jgi:hypothetical protein
MYQRISGFVKTSHAAANNPEFRGSYAQSYIQMFYEPPLAHFVYLLCFASLIRQRRKSEVPQPNMTDWSSLFYLFLMDCKSRNLTKPTIRRYGNGLKKARTTLKNPKSRMV